MLNCALFAVRDNVTGRFESFGVHVNKSSAARCIVAMYAFSANPSVSKRLCDYDLVQLTDFFDLDHIDDVSLKADSFVTIGSLAKIKQQFDLDDGVFSFEGEASNDRL